MRTTLTLDDDVAVQLERMRETQKISLRDVVNTAMRKGLMLMEKPAPAAKTICKTPVFHAACSMVGEMTSTAEMLAVAEGETFK